MESPHPSEQALAAYRSGRLDQGTAGVVRQHLETCSECRGRAASMSSASFLDWVGGAQKEARASRTEETLTENGKDMSSPPPVDSLPPGLADHRDYEIRKELGRGGMGVVYLAHNTLLGRDEVLKVMGRQIMARPGVLDRFLREIRAVAKLRHPNIVSAYSAFRLDESIVFAMEYIEGLDLSKMVRAKGPLPVAHASMFAYQTALGLQHAHEEGLAHRDIKPGNLMLSRNGERATIKILDFGLARATRDEKVDSSLTADGQILGTPDFIAPEQILNARSADIRADIYSLGGTLYYLLIGRPPFIAKSFHDICQAHIARTADPLNLVRPEVPAELAAIVARMMAKDPARRPQSPREVSDALTPFFKKTKAVDASPRVEISRVGADFGRTQLASDEGKGAVPAGQAVPTSVAESRWESLVDCRDDDSPRTPVAADLAGQQGTGKTRSMIIAASLLGVVTLAAAILILARTPKPDDSRSRTLVDDPAKVTQVPLPKVAKRVGNEPLEPTPEPRKADASYPESAASGALPQSVAGSDDKQPSREAAAATISSDDSLKLATRSVYSDDFNDAGSRWPKGESHGYADGVYFVSPGNSWQSFRAPSQIRTDAIVEVVGRLKSEQPISRGSWAVTVSRSIGTGSIRGFVVQTNGKGELFLKPHPSKDANEFRAVDPTIGPIVHPAIKPGDQWNTLTLLMKKRTLEILVNSVRVCGPLTLEYDLASTHLLLGAFDGPTKARAEFDRVEVREFVDDKPPVAAVTDDSIRRVTHSVFLENFDDSGSGWQRGGGKDYAPGVYFVDPGGGRSYWRAPRRIRTDGTLLVVGRMKVEGPVTKGSWAVVVGSSAGPAHRGFMVKINGKGELFLKPSPAPSAKEFLGIEPTLGPIVHPAIKPGDQSNALLLVMKKRVLEIFVNSVRVCDPVTFAFDLAPASFSLGAWDGPANFRAEFEKVEIREFWDLDPRLSPTAYRSIASATRPVYFDDFTDPKSGWSKSERWGYSSGVYFVIPRDDVSVHKSPGGLRADSALVVVGRLKTAGTSSRGSWVVIINHEMGAVSRGFMVKVSGKGELFLLPNPWKDAKDFVHVDPTIGPIVHPAIKPANQVNRVVLLVRKRSVEIFVNSVRVCEPVPYDFDLTPAFIQLGAWDGPGDFRAEFDSMTIRGFTRP